MLRTYKRDAVTCFACGLIKYLNHITSVILENAKGHRQLFKCCLKSQPTGMVYGDMLFQIIFIDYKFVDGSRNRNFVEFARRNTIEIQ